MQRGQNPGRQKRKMDLQTKQRGWKPQKRLNLILVNQLKNMKRSLFVLFSISVVDISRSSLIESQPLVYLNCQPDVNGGQLFIQSNYNIGQLLKYVRC